MNFISIKNLYVGKAKSLINYEGILISFASKSITLEIMKTNK